MTYIVYEYTENASPQYRGTRFMTLYTGEINPNADSEKLPESQRLKVIAKDISEEEAYRLIDMTEDKNIAAHLSEYPQELLSPEARDFITNLIKNDTTRNI